MATSIPPHNLAEVIEAVKAYMLDENITTRELMRAGFSYKEDS